MSLNKSQSVMRAAVRKFANVQGTTAALRHPDADLNDYINRALGSLHRKLTTALPDQRFLALDSITTSDGTSEYALEADFEALISAEIEADSHRTWLQAYEMHERPALVSSDVPNNGIPYCYRLRGENIELLPTPDDAYTVRLWYLPTVDQLAGDAETYDTISRLDDYVIAYAARPIAIKDKNWDLASACKAVMDELSGDIEVLARNRDRNSPPRVIDVFQTDRWGRSRYRR